MIKKNKYTKTSKIVEIDKQDMLTIVTIVLRKIQDKEQFQQEEVQDYIIDENKIFHNLFRL